MSDVIQDFYDQRPYPFFDHQRLKNSKVPAQKAAAAIHHGFGGIVPSDKKLRILIAGGGSGMGLVLLGLGFTALGIDADFTYLDISETSRKTAESRANAVGLTEVKYLTGNIEKLSDLPAGQYDYIDFVGVLNHVANPQGCLEALSHALADDGTIACMAYGRTGRTGIYEFQKMVFQLLGPEPDITIARSILEALPENNWLRKNPLYEHLLEADDTEFADALLNPRDRAFNTSDLQELFTGAGLAHLRFTPPMFYDPAAILKNEESVRAAKALPSSDQRLIAELLLGDLNKHFLYASKQELLSAYETAISSPEALICLNTKLKLPDNTGADQNEAVHVKIAVEFDGRKRNISTHLSATEVELVRRLGKPVSMFALKDGFSPSDFAKAFERLYRMLTAMDMLHVVHRA